MKVLYDPEHNACAVEFDKDDCLFTSIEEGKIFIESSLGGKPEMVEERLNFELGEHSDTSGSTEVKGICR